jgi:predicted nucleotidyltransferase
MVIYKNNSNKTLLDANYVSDVNGNDSILVVECINSRKCNDDIVVQGSRASGTAAATSDIDIAIKVNSKQFDELIEKSFGTPNPGSAFERTMQHAIKVGKIQAGEADLSSLRKNLEKLLGIKVDISIIKNGGGFDNGSQIPVKGVK